MFRHFDVHKAIQVAGVLLRAERNRMSYLRLLKLLYIADREALRETGMPLLGSKSVAMDNGPLHSDLYDLVKGIHENTPLWSKFFSTVGYQVEMVDQPDNGLLSQYEIEKIQSTVAKYAPFTDYQICQEMTHTFDEWRKRYEEGTSKPIQLEDIIDAIGRGGDKASIMEDLLELEEFDKLMSQA
ncbi:MAG: SocA family protein [Planctomycetes bacterium]|nr:SocA family protein [Planctomycetota bacterium]